MDDELSTDEEEASDAVGLGPTDCPSSEEVGPTTIEETVSVAEEEAPVEITPVDDPTAVEEAPEKSDVDVGIPVADD